MCSNMSSIVSFLMSVCKLQSTLVTDEEKGESWFFGVYLNVLYEMKHVWICYHK